MCRPGRLPVRSGAVDAHEAKLIGCGLMSQARCLITPNTLPHSMCSGLRPIMLYASQGCSSRCRHSNPHPEEWMTASGA